jgi:hypothetical protein
MQKFRTRWLSVGTAPIVGGDAHRPWQDAAVPALILALLLLGAGVAMELNRDRLIRRVTSRSLGSLAPGYAATKTGIRVYTALVVALGLLAFGVWAIDWSKGLGLVVGLLGVAAFLVLSVIAIVGEVRTFRALKR